MSPKAITSGLTLCLLLGAAGPAATARAERSRPSACQASKKAKGKASAGRTGQGAGKSKAGSSPAAAASESESDMSDDLSGLDDVAPAKQPEPVVSKPRPSAPPPETTREATPADEEAETASEADAEAPATQDDAETAPPPESAAQEGESGPSVRIEPYAGAGISTRSVRMPSKDGALEVAPGVTPAAEVGLRVLIRPNADISFFAHLVYQSALGFSVTEHAPLALEKEVRARSERVSLEVAPRWRFGGGNQELAIPLGVTVRTLWAEVHTSQTPSYSLVGPHARIELRLAFVDKLWLRFGPDVQYIMMVDKDLTTAGVASQGVALGGDASIEAQVSEVWSFRVTYRESHALLAAARGTVSFQDVERYLTLRAVGSF